MICSVWRSAWEQRCLIFVLRIVKGDFSTTLRFARNDEGDALMRTIHFSPFITGRKANKIKA